MKRKTLTPPERARGVLASRWFPADASPLSRAMMTMLIADHIRAAVRAALRKRRGTR